MPSCGSPPVAELATWRAMSANMGWWSPSVQRRSIVAVGVGVVRCVGGGGLQRAARQERGIKYAVPGIRQPPEVLLGAPLWTHFDTS